MYAGLHNSIFCSLQHSHRIDRLYATAAAVVVASAMSVVVGVIQPGAVEYKPPLSRTLVKNINTGGILIILFEKWKEHITLSNHWNKKHFFLITGFYFEYNDVV